MAKRKKRVPMSVPDKQQLRVSRQTLRYSDAGAKVMGGQTKAEARAFIAKMKREGKISK